MKLLEPIQVGNQLLKNRIMLPPLTTGYEGKNGEITEKSINFYTRIAQGGAAYIVIGDVSPIPTVSPTPRLYSDELIAGFKTLADNVHQYGAKLGLQIFHPEYDVEALLDLFQKGDMVAAREKMHYDMLHFASEVSSEKLLKIIDAMCETAKRAQKAGSDFIQIHGDRLTGCLCSPIMNHRTDEFGGNFENRTRFALTLVKKLKEAVPTMGIDYKFSIITPERGKGGIPLEEAPKFAKQLEAAGVDMLHVAQANHTGNLADTIPPMGVQPYGFFVDIAAQMKEHVSIPVSAVGRIVTPKMAEAILEEGKADIIALGRPLFTDPDWAVKLEKGEPIRECMMCNSGCCDVIQKRGFVSCVLNAENGFEYKKQIIKTTSPKNVVIVGGGLAGMEAARVATLKGHHVTLFEAEMKLGGQIHLAAVPPRKEEMLRSYYYLEKEMQRLKIDIRFGKKATIEDIEACKPDAVIMALGAKPFIPNIPGKDFAAVVDAWDVLANKEQVFGKTIVIGGGLVGIETAEYLADRNCEVTIIEMADEIGKDIGSTVKPAIMEIYEKHDVIQLPKHKVKEITTNEVICDNEQGEVRIPYNFVVMAIGSREVPFDITRLEEKNIPVTFIGDCKTQSSINFAIKSGYDAANAIL